jgi:anionic cell wall polymer biosynthesis LytR-Cps2A-Psr (LCP) family protein
MEVIKGVMQKASSPELLTNFDAVLAGVKDCFETNMPYELLTTLVSTQLSNVADWNVQTFSVDGTGASRVPYSMNQEAYVMLPNTTTIVQAKTLMQKILDGDTVDIEKENLMKVQVEDEITEDEITEDVAIDRTIEVAQPETDAAAEEASTDTEEAADAAASTKQ